MSTTDQNCEIQLGELREYAGRQDWTIFDEYIDHGISGAKATRPALKRLMFDARLKRFDAVVVWKIDRFGRSVAQLIENVQTLDSYGIRFVAVTQGIDTDRRNPSGRLLLHILASLAEFERELIRERTISGVRAAKAAGKVLGRPRRIFRRDEAIRLRKAGASWRAIAEQLGIPVSTARDALACAEIVPNKALSGAGKTKRMTMAV